MKDEKPSKQSFNQNKHIPTQCNELVLSKKSICCQKHDTLFLDGLWPRPTACAAQNFMLSVPYLHPFRNYVAQTIQSI